MRVASSSPWDFTSVMDASSDTERRDGLAAVSRGSKSSRCAAPASLSPAAGSQQRRASSPASAAQRESAYVLCERAGDRQQRDSRRARAVVMVQRAHATEVEADSGVLTSSGYPASAPPDVRSALSCRKADPAPLPAAACKGALTAGVGSPAPAAGAALPLQWPSMEITRRRVPGPKSPLVLLSNNNTSRSSRSSSHEVSLGLSAAIARELTCPICLELFRLPVTVVCGHSFCRYCIGHKKLSRKACPLCRQDIGESFAVNTVLCNLLACFTSRRQQQQQRRHGSPVSTFLPLNAHCPVDEDWWAQHCVKPRVAAPLAIRLLFPEVAEESGLLLDDLVACVLDAFDCKSLWADQRWQAPSSPFSHCMSPVLSSGSTCSISSLKTAFLSSLHLIYIRARSSSPSLSIRVYSYVPSQAAGVTFPRVFLGYWGIPLCNHFCCVASCPSVCRCFTLRDAETLSRMVGFDHNDRGKADRHAHGHSREGNETWSNKGTRTGTQAETQRATLLDWGTKVMACDDVCQRQLGSGCIDG